MDFSKLESLMAAKGISTLASIARALGTTPQAVSNWKSRDQVPYHIVGKIKQLDNLTNKNESGSYFQLEDNVEIPLSFSKIIIGILSQLRFIFIASFTMLFFTFIYIKFVQAPYYISNSSFILDSKSDKDGGGSISGLAQIARSYGINLNQSFSADMTSNAALLPELITTRTFSDRILKKSFYSKKYGKKLSLLQILVTGEEESRLDSNLIAMVGMGELQKMVKLTTGEAFISTLEVETFEPELALEINNEILYELGEINKFYRSQNIDNTINYLENRIGSVEASLNSFEKELKEFREKNRQISTSPALQLAEGRIITNVDIQKNIYLTLKQQLELSRIDRLEESSVLKIIDAPNKPLLPSNKNLKLSLIISLLFSLCFTFPIAFIKGYYLKTENEKRRKLLKVNKALIKTIKNILFDRIFMMSISIVLVIGLPFFLQWNSQDPIYFDRYSLKALIIVICYIITMLVLGIASIVKYKREKS